MNTYHFTNSKTSENYTRQFKTYNEAYHWIVNHLDLSLEWTIETIK